MERPYKVYEFAFNALNFFRPFLASAICVNSIALGLTKWLLFFLADDPSAVGISAARRTAVARVDDGLCAGGCLRLRLLQRRRRGAVAPRTERRCAGAASPRIGAGGGGGGGGRAPPPGAAPRGGLPGLHGGGGSYSPPPIRSDALSRYFSTRLMSLMRSCVETVPR